jgi:hypothetical protein
MTDDESLHRLFTLDEANELLPTLIPLLTPSMRSNGHGAEAADLDQRLADIATELSLGIRQVLELGVEIKDLNLGLIDFPSVRDNRIVYLCWRLGEGPIAFWHELDTGFAGRQPL